MPLTLPREDEIQESVITRTKEIDFENLMTSTEVREYQYKGAEFTYPNLRVDITDVTYNAERCNFHDVVITIYAYSEKSTSKQANRLAGIVANAYTPNAFLRNGIQFYGIHVTGVERATDTVDGEWEAKVTINAMVVK